MTYTYRAVERTNILGVVNLVVKGLIETSMKQGKTLNDVHPQLQQCLIAMEMALKHRLKSESTSHVTCGCMYNVHVYVYICYTALPNDNVLHTLCICLYCSI